MDINELYDQRQLWRTQPKDCGRNDDDNDDDNNEPATVAPRNRTNPRYIHFSRARRRPVEGPFDRASGKETAPRWPHVNTVPLCRKPTGQTPRPTNHSLNLKPTRGAVLASRAQPRAAAVGCDHFPGLALSTLAWASPARTRAIVRVSPSARSRSYARSYTHPHD